MLKGVITISGKQTWENYLNDNTSVYPYPIRQLIVQFASGERKSWLSPSVINGCLKKAYLEFHNENYLPETNVYKMVRGSFIHKVLECSLSEQKNSYKELKLSYTLPEIGFTLTGTLDYWFDGILHDYKTIQDDKIYKIVKEGTKQDHVIQTNIYKWLLEKTLGVKSSGIKIIYISMIGCFTTGYPYSLKDKYGVVHEGILENCPIIPNEKLEDYLNNRLAFLKTNPDNPPITRNEWCKYCMGYKDCFPQVVEEEVELF
jgi:hypothetical protein